MIMEIESLSKRIFSFFLTKIFIGILVLAIPVWLIEWAGHTLLQKIKVSEDLQNGLISVAVSAASLISYVLLFRWYENRQVTELRSSLFIKNANTGFIAGLILQSLFVYIIYLAGHYRILVINPVSYLLPALVFALTAGFVSELIIRGIVFRILEQQFGTTITISFMTILFGIFHAGAKGSNLYSVVSTASAAGFLLSAVYVYSRNLWFPIFFHFAWDFAEPGIFGGINPGNRVGKSLFSSEISGPIFLSGGEAGPQNSLQAAIICLATGFLFLLLAKRKNNFILPGRF
jgi:uncharacterized protein